MTRAELKALTKQQIKGKIGTYFIMLLIVIGIAAAIEFAIGALSEDPFAPLGIQIAASLFIYAPLTIGLIGVQFKISNGEDIRVSNLFDRFMDWWGTWKVAFFITLFTVLWSLLLVVPGIIKGFSYSMAMYIFAENPKMDALEAIKRSKEMMNGRRMDLFVLCLSFIPWILLSFITFGIALIWVEPYMEVTMVNFYKQLKAERNMI